MSASRTIQEGIWEELRKTAGSSPAIENFSGLNVESLNVDASTTGTVNVVSENTASVVFMTLDGTTPTASNGIALAGQTQLLLQNVRLDLIRLVGLGIGTTYSILYAIYA